MTSTPSSRWRENDKPDPHGDRYDCERAQLPLGDMTDDQLANAVFLDPSIVNLTAMKDRIRWLSRALESAIDAARMLEANNRLLQRVRDAEAEITRRRAEVEKMTRESDDYIAAESRLRETCAQWLKRTESAEDRARDAKRKLAMAVEVIDEYKRAIGDHYAPNDCYATGPVTGDPFRDLVECPACSALAKHEKFLAELEKDAPPTRRSTSL